MQKLIERPCRKAILGLRDCGWPEILNQILNTQYRIDRDRSLQGIHYRAWKKAQTRTPEGIRYE